MKYSDQMYRKILTLFTILMLTLSTTSSACTTMSCVAENGHVWNANNEDGPFGVANFINVFPSENDNELGYYTLCYISPMYAQGGKIQGGMNEAGLTYDFNTINVKGAKNPSLKKPFPQGDTAILAHILKTMSSVDEVIAFFDEYWFQRGLTAAQMHVADRSGKFAIISTSGVQVTENGKSLVSTNYDIVANDVDPDCWRNPTASKILNEQKISLETLIKACKATEQKNGATMYSNIQNLTTGELWFFSKHNEGNLVKTTLQDLLARGKTSYTFSNLTTLNEPLKQYINTENTVTTINQDILEKYTGTYAHPYLGDTIVTERDGGLLLTFGDGVSISFTTQSESIFFAAEEPLKISFEEDKGSKTTQLRLYEGDFWCFTISKNG